MNLPPEDPEYNQAGRDPRFPAGWWILPMIILSLVGVGWIILSLTAP